MNERDKIIEEIAADEDPTYRDKSAIMDDDKTCRYCRVNFEDTDTHLDTCIWERAKGLIREDELTPHVTYVVKGPIDENTDDVCNSMHCEIITANPNHPFAPPHEVQKPELPCRCYTEEVTIEIVASLTQPASYGILINVVDVDNFSPVPKGKLGWEGNITEMRQDNE